MSEVDRARRARERGDGDALLEAKPREPEPGRAKEWLAFLLLVVGAFVLVAAIPLAAFAAHAVWTLLAWGWGWGR